MCHWWDLRDRFSEVEIQMFRSEKDHLGGLFDSQDTKRAIVAHRICSV